MKTDQLIKFLTDQLDMMVSNMVVQSYKYAVLFFNPADSGPQVVLLTSALGESLLAETEM